MTGLIYVAIVALWAAVLLPMWLRRHDDDQARRIERHRVAMGTLARIADHAERAETSATRRRRLILCATATLGALATAAWVAGFLPGLATVAAWVPFLAFLPAAVLAGRRALQRNAERALEERRLRRRQADASRASESTPAPAPPAATTRAPAWDQVFDQTA